MSTASRPIAILFCLAAACCADAACTEYPAGGRHAQRSPGAAEALLTASPVRYDIPDGKRLLAASRRATDRVLLFGLVQ